MIGVPQMLISRHVAKLLDRSEDESRLGELLAAAGMIRRGGIVEKADESEVTMDDCHRYKQLVRAMFGETAYRFAKVNFTLGGCTCADCQRTTNIQ